MGVTFSSENKFYDRKKDYLTMTKYYLIRICASLKGCKKDVGRELALFLLNFFKVYHFYSFTFRNYFILCKIVLCI